MPDDELLWSTGLLPKYSGNELLTSESANSPHTYVARSYMSKSTETYFIH